MCWIIKLFKMGRHAEYPFKLAPDLLQKLGSPEAEVQDAALIELQQLIVRLYISVIEWYDRNVQTHRCLAKWLRRVGIGCLGAASLWPAILSVNLFELILEDTSNIDRLGYLVAALGAVALAADKFSGVSTGWIRFIRTQIRLRKELDKFQTDWALILARSAESGDTNAHRTERLNILKSATDQLWTIVMDETAKWADGYLDDLGGLHNSLASVTTKHNSPAG